MSSFYKYLSLTSYEQPYMYFLSSLYKYLYTEPKIIYLMSSFFKYFYTEPKIINLMSSFYKYFYIL